jgi:hypothetical protein
MKLLSLLITTIFATQGFAQSKEEKEILSLSRQICRWEVDNKIDSLEILFDEKFVVVSSNGERQNKKQYITRLRSGDFIHNRINVEKDTSSVANNTAVVVGKGKFSVAVSGNNRSLHLSYTEVFTRPDAKKPWKLLAIHASMLEQ